MSIYSSDSAYAKFLNQGFRPLGIDVKPSAYILERTIKRIINEERTELTKSSYCQDTKTRVQYTEYVLMIDGVSYDYNRFMLLLEKKDSEQLTAVKNRISNYGWQDAVIYELTKKRYINRG